MWVKGIQYTAFGSNIRFDQESVKPGQRPGIRYLVSHIPVTLKS